MGEACAASGGPPPLPPHPTPPPPDARSSAPCRTLPWQRRAPYPRPARTPGQAFPHPRAGPLHPCSGRASDTLRRLPHGTRPRLPAPRPRGSPPSTHAVPEPNAPSGFRDSREPRLPAARPASSPLPAEEHPPLPAPIPLGPGTAEVGPRKGSAPRVRAASCWLRRSERPQGAQCRHRAAVLITCSTVPHAARAPKERSGLPEQGRGHIGKRVSGCKCRQGQAGKTDGRGPTLGEQRSGRGTCA